MEEELKIEEMKLEMKKKNEDKIKFPKLVITKLRVHIWIGADFGINSQQELLRLR